ncbi:hypothetical protein NJ7G_0291 [Natrinema sp. J7-2]|nr:hypothetical protein NJ7G_0291 [Natrinema sp. J7-2]
MARSSQIRIDAAAPARSSEDYEVSGWRRTRAATDREPRERVQ